MFLAGYLLGIVRSSKRKKKPAIFFLTFPVDCSSKMYLAGYLMGIVRVQKKKNPKQNLNLPYLMISVVKCISLVI